MRIKNRAVVTGLGVVAPNGIGKEAFWTSLIEGRSGIGALTLFDGSDLPCRIAGEVRDFKIEELLPINPKEARRMARSAQFATASTAMALQDARLDLPEIDAQNAVPIVMGVSTSAMDLIALKPRPWTAISAVPHAVSSAVKFALGFDAALTTISNGCASGVDAIAVGAEEIWRGKSDIVIAGAADSSITRYVFECFSSSRKLSTRNDDPGHASRPFDRTRDGGIIAEAAGVLILENLENARARGATIYAEITGYGTNADTAQGPMAFGLKQSMLKAIDNTPCLPEQIDAIAAHAPSDREMDCYEVALIKEVFGKHAYRIPVTSIKGATGNPMGAGGILQCIAAAMSIHNGCIPPTVNLEEPGPGCDLDHVPKRARDMLLGRFMVNTHGFGRGNSSLVLQQVADT